MHEKKRKNIILSFDLDNTLINNREGIITSFNYALNKYNLPLKEESEIEHMIGIPLVEMFESITSYDSTKLVFAFRDYYGRKGIYQANILPGIKATLKELSELSYTLGVITSKKQEMAVKVLEILKLHEYFDYVIGETEETKELGKLDPKLKLQIEENYPGYKIIIIGDHPKDVLLSNNLNCPFIGVLTGHHSSKQLKEIKKGKAIILKSVSEITDEIILSLI